MATSLHLASEGKIVDTNSNELLEFAQTADAQGNTGVNILSAPQNIEVTGMAFQTNQLNTGILIEKAKNCSFNNVDVIGPLTTVDLIVSTDNTKAVDWSSTTSLPCTQIVFDNCRFSGFTYGINTHNKSTVQ